MAKTKEMCRGCEDDFYNGNNPYNVQECWSYKNAKIEMRKRVSMHQVPPWTQKPSKYLTCYHQRGYVFVDGGRTC